MDQFYLKNAPLYKNLVKDFNTKSASQTPKESTGTCNPNMIVAARIRPLSEDDLTAGYPLAVFPLSGDSNQMDVHDLYNHPRGRPILKSSKYEVDRLFDANATTEDIYEKLVVPLVPFAWNGGIGTLFSYGQTGSGKTFTVSRLEQLVAESLWNNTLQGQREIYITIIDLAGSAAFDLLQSRKPILVLEDSFGAMQLSGTDEILVQSKQDMMQLIDQATLFRKTETTVKNDASSRSHAICRIRIKDTSTDSDGMLYLIDLAGSEAFRDIGSHGPQRAKETREINMSLSVLKDCIRGKAESDIIRSSTGPKQKMSRIPYRQSTLTKVLKHVFDPTKSETCKTVVIACLNPSLVDVGPSRNSLRFAEALRVFLPASGQVEFDPVSPMTWSNAQLQGWIAKNSGTPPILPIVLAPTESGAQLLRISETQFHKRCLQTPGTTLAQAEAFRSKLWQMHIDSQRVTNGNDATGPSSASKMSSRDLQDPTSLDVDFKERIRPGMVVSWSQPGEAISEPEGLNIAVVLSHTGLVHESMNVASGSLRASKEGRFEGSGYLCALVVPGAIPDAYELNLWRQVVIDIDVMENEVYLEYDSGSRYYYISV